MADFQKMASMTAPVVRRLTAADAPSCLKVSEAVRWSHDLGVWERMIALAGEGALCVSVSDEIAATNIVTVYSRALAWIGLVITHPAHQRQGYGRLLMDAAMAYIHRRGVACAMLDATEAGRPLYESFGFRGVYRIEVWTGRGQSGQRSGSAGAAVRPMIVDDLPSVSALDAALFGVRRPDVLLPRLQNAWVASEPTGSLVSGVAGYLLCQENAYGAVLGPWYHPDADRAEDLLRSALNGAGDMPVRVHIPEQNTYAKDIAARCGLTFSRACTRMVHGQDPPGHMADQFAIASFATG